MIDNQSSTHRHVDVEHGQAGHHHDDERIIAEVAKEEYIKNQEKSFESLTNFYAKQHKSHAQ